MQAKRDLVSVRDTCLNLLTTLLKCGATPVICLEGLRSGGSYMVNSGDSAPMRAFKMSLQCVRAVADALGVQCVVAPAEAEACCAYLQRMGYVDVVWSGDSDAGRWVLCPGVCVSR